jgi:transcriptional regulator with XRE-family HTH domain
MSKKQIQLEVDLRRSSVGNFLKQSRETAELSQFEVAKKLGYKSSQFISNWERGLSSPPAEILPRLVKLYSINPNDLLAVIQSYQEELLSMQQRYLSQLLKKRV